MKIIRSVSEMIQVRQQLSGKVGIVPTMGALHEGHISLVQQCRSHSDHVVVSIYVNPLQFGPKEDFDKYPRNLSQDTELLSDEGVDIVFAPEELGEQNSETKVIPGELSTLWCGKNRPQHFEGVLSVITKLFNIISPTDAWFGQKDFQQFRIIEKWVEDFYVPVNLHRAMIVREKMGLAISSRNAYLNLDQKYNAKNIYKSLTAAKSAFMQGETSTKVVLELSKDYLKKMKIEYHAIIDPVTLKPCDKVFIGSVLVLAVKLGQVRLIDNMIFDM